MIACLIEIILKSPMILKAISELIGAAPIANDILALFHNQSNAELRAHVIGQVQSALDASSATAMWPNLLKMLRVENVNKFLYEKLTKCDRCSVSNVFRMEYGDIQLTLSEKIDEVNMARMMLDYEEKGVPDNLHEYFMLGANCSHTFLDDIKWTSCGTSMYFAFARNNQLANGQLSISTTKVTLPLVISFASKAFELYGFLCAELDEGTNRMTYYAIMLDAWENGGTKRAIKIDENGLTEPNPAFDNLRKVTSTNVVLALYDDITLKQQLVPRPFELIDNCKEEPELETFMSSPSKSNADDENELNMLDEWIDKLLHTKLKQYIVHDVLSDVVSSQKCLSKSISKYIGTCGFVVIIRHHGHGHTHDHLIHDCEWNEEACRCKFTRKMQAQASHQKAIRWTDTDRSFFTILFDSLQMENIVFAYSGGDLLIHNFETNVETNVVKNYGDHPYIDWAECDPERRLTNQEGDMSQ